MASMVSTLAFVGSLSDDPTTVQEELLVDDSQLQPWKAKSEIPVQVGDYVEVAVPDKQVTTIG